MQVNVNQQFQMLLNRNKGGALVRAQVDAWEANGTDWHLVKSFPMLAVLATHQNTACQLPRGTYLCVFRVEVEESLNGVYDYDYFVDGSKVFFGKGDVNTTAATNDSAAFKEQFLLVVN